MPTYKELGQSAKKKYPQYKNLPDEQVGKALAEKYPQYQKTITSKKTLPGTNINRLPGPLGALQSLADLTSRKVSPDTIQGIIDSAKEFKKQSDIFANKNTTASQKLEAFRAGGEAGTNIIFSPFNAALEGISKIPGGKYPVEGLNQVFGGIGKVGGGIARGIASNPLIPESPAKENTKKFAESFGSLAAQLLAAKAGSDIYKSTVGKYNKLVKETKNAGAEDVIPNRIGVPDTNKKNNPTNDLVRNNEELVKKSEVTKTKTPDLTDSVIGIQEPPTLRAPKFSDSLAGISRTKHFEGFAKDLVASLEKDPSVIKEIQQSGGGRVVSHSETLSKAAEEIKSQGIANFGEELRTWKPGTPVNEVMIAKAKLYEGYWNKMYEEALSNNDAAAAKLAADNIASSYGAFRESTATAGRSLNIIQAEVSKKIAELTKQIVDAKDLPFEEQQRVYTEAQKTIKRLKQFEQFSGVLGKTIHTLENYATGAKLTSVSTHIVNTVSNFFTWLQRGGEKYLRSALLNFKGKGLEAKAVRAKAFGTWNGFSTGIQKALSTLVEDIPDLAKSERASSYFGNIADKLPRKLRVGLRTTNPFRWLSAADNFWKAILYDSALQETALLDIYKKHGDVKGIELTKLLEDSINNAPDNWKSKAWEVAKEYTFQSDPGRTLGLLLKARNVPLARFIIPFVQTPAKIFEFQYRRGPLGLLSKENIRGMLSSPTLREEAISRIAIGTALTAMAYIVAENNDITGGYPSDQRERARWKAEGIKPWSIRIGNRRLQYNRFQPVGLYLTQAAILRDMIHHKNDVQLATAVPTLILDLAAAVKDMPFVSGLSSIFNALDDPERYLSAFFGQTITGLIPNVSRDIRQQVDPTLRTAKSLSDYAKNSIPGLSNSLPAQYTVLGDKLNYAPNRFERWLKFTNPETQSVITKALDDVNWSPVEPNTSLTFKRGLKTYEATLTTREQEKFLEDLGKGTKLAISKVISLPNYANLDTDAKIYLLNTTINSVREKIRNSWKVKVITRFKAK